MSEVLPGRMLVLTVCLPYPHCPSEILEILAISCLRTSKILRVLLLIQSSCHNPSVELKKIQRIYSPPTPVGSLAWELYYRFALYLPYSCHQKSILRFISFSLVWQGGRERIEYVECHLVAGFTMCVVDILSEEVESQSFRGCSRRLVAGSLWGVLMSSFRFANPTNGPAVLYPSYCPEAVPLYRNELPVQWTNLRIRCLKFLS